MGSRPGLLIEDRLRQERAPRLVGIGVDRLDYAKEHSRRLDAIDRC